MKIVSALALVAALSLSLPVPVWAQQMTGKNGAVLDGMGAGGQEANRYRYDGPPNADAIGLSDPKITSRVNAYTGSNACRPGFQMTDECWRLLHEYRARQPMGSSR